MRAGQNQPIHFYLLLIMTEISRHTSALPLAPADPDDISRILDDLRTRDDDIPAWEFCDGFMAALVCWRHPIEPSEYLPVLFGGLPHEDEAVSGLFASEAQFEQFVGLWMRRWNAVTSALDADVTSLDDQRAYAPNLVDVRAALSGLTPSQCAELGIHVDDLALPFFGQVWALGFMYAVENWPQDWAMPDDPQAAKIFDAALQCLVTLAEDDSGPFTVADPEAGGKPSMSEQRVDDLAYAIWALYDLRNLWREHHRC